MPRDLDWAIKKSIWDLHLHVSILYSLAAFRYDSELLSFVFKRFVLPYQCHRYVKQKKLSARDAANIQFLPQQQNGQLNATLYTMKNVKQGWYTILKH